MSITEIYCNTFSSINTINKLVKQKIFGNILPQLSSGLHPLCSTTVSYWLYWICVRLQYSYLYVCLSLDGSCNTNDDCEPGLYCDSNKCISSCENSLDCSNGVCRSVTFGSSRMRLCKEECNDMSNPCQGGEMCVGKGIPYHMYCNLII